MEVYQSRPFGCEVGSQFHQSDVSRGPPIMPDCRISQVRFEALAFPLLGLPSLARFKRWFATPDFHGLPIASFHGRQRLNASSVSGSRLPMKTAKCPESLCPTSQLLHRGGLHIASCEDVTPRSSLIRTHSPIPFGSSSLRPLLSERSLRRLLPAPAANGIFPTLSLRIFPQMPGPLPRRYHGVHLPVSSSVSSAFPMK